MSEEFNEQTNEKHLKYQRLIKFGTLLLQKLHAGETNINVSSWVTDSIDHILPVMPLDIPEYNKSVELLSLYQDTYLRAKVGFDDTATAAYFRNNETSTLLKVKSGVNGRLASLKTSR